VCSQIIQSTKCLFFIRSGLLACLEKDSSYLALHDVHHAALSGEEGEPAVLERRLSPAYSEDVYSSANGSLPPLSSFAWHPTHENLITTSTSSGIFKAFHFL